MTKKAPCPPDDVMIRDWYGVESGNDLCRRYGIKLNSLHDQWSRLKLTGKLPWKHRSHVNGLWKPKEEGHHSDPERELQSLRSRSDKLLALLREHHGLDGRADIYPRT